MPNKNSVHDTDSVPNGGFTAWLQVLGGFLLLFNTWGVMNTFGVYQTYYESGELFQESSTRISWIGSVQTFCLLFFGTLTGPIFDAGYFRVLLYSGFFMLVFGQMMLSLCTTFWQVVLAQGICIGIGTGLLFVPSVAIISTYFTTKIALAMGFAASGSGMGGVIYPIVFHRLHPAIGFAWATRVIGFMELGTLLVPLAVMRVRTLPPKVRKLIDWSAFSDLPYITYILGTLVGYMGLFVPFFYISYYAIQQKFTNENLGFYMLPILNSASVFGRLLPNIFADKLGVVNTMIPCSFVTSILAFCLIRVDNQASIIVCTILYGFFSGAYVSLPPTIMVFLTPDRSLIGTRLGQGFATISFGVLVSTPAAGAILRQDSWTHIWIYSGVLLFVAACSFVLVRKLKGSGGVNVGH
ncbi:MFS general substrate transporter [Pseudomassariella vexata]|uniref:MFS general substrate transporter n=1 Tax=Pseudomassariella vexata TaxID=1141098 RepID=A0A1Y2DKM7_9PEZI|nr:MFS general substrate transporter [Pseudomassariella vexata]ORY59305.1 MFS general substrate transporter [Pseudomassariella vexata]